MGASPRTLLLTWWPPDLRYAGGEFVRRLVGALPPDSIRWACLTPMSPRETGSLLLPCSQSFVPLSLHWRVRRTKLAAVALVEAAGLRVASQIARWVAGWKPEVLWVLPELGAIRVAKPLQDLLGIPLHLTLHDAHECAGYEALPSWYMPWYLRRAYDVVRRAASVDGISKELIEHVLTNPRAQQPLRPAPRTMVFPPSISRSAIVSEVDSSPKASTFRIALCGSMRTGTAQWQRFAEALAADPKRVEVVAIGDASLQADMMRGRGIQVIAHDYFDQEADLIAYLRDQRVCAGYAGVWSDEDRRLFARTSFSSKIVTYAAAGIPVVFDGPEDSAAWVMLSRWKAGMLWDGSGAAHLALQDLRTGSTTWRSMASGALAMCRKDLCLEDNTEQFQTLLRETATQGWRREDWTL